MLIFLISVNKNFNLIAQFHGSLAFTQLITINAIIKALWLIIKVLGLIITSTTHLKLTAIEHYRKFSQFWHKGKQNFSHKILCGFYFLNTEIKGE